MAFVPLGFISFEKSINYSFCMRMPCVAVSANLENKADYTRLVAMVMTLPITKLMPVKKKEWLQSLIPKFDAAIEAVDGKALETTERLGAEATDGMDVGDTALDASAASQEAKHVTAAPASEAAAEQTTATPTAAAEQNAATPKQKLALTTLASHFTVCFVWERVPVCLALSVHHVCSCVCTPVDQVISHFHKTQGSFCDERF